MIGTRCTPLEAFKYYIAVKQHFNNKKFNLFDKGACIRATIEQLEERNDKSFFFKLSGDYLKGDLLNFYMANILAGRVHPSEMEDVIFKEWRTKIHTIAYKFEQDLIFLIGLGHGFKPLFRTKSGKLPVAIQAMNGGHIMLDTICIIDRLTNGATMKSYDAEITDNFNWKPIRERIAKYSNWVQTDYKKLNEILKTYIKET